jgi:hypothetical protein
MFEKEQLLFVTAVAAATEKQDTAAAERLRKAFEQRQSTWELSKSMRKSQNETTPEALEALVEAHQGAMKFWKKAIIDFQQWLVEIGSGMEVIGKFVQEFMKEQKLISDEEEESLVSLGSVEQRCKTQREQLSRVRQQLRVQAALHMAGSSSGQLFTGGEVSPRTPLSPLSFRQARQISERLAHQQNNLRRRRKNPRKQLRKGTALSLRTFVAVAGQKENHGRRHSNPDVLTISHSSASGSSSAAVQVPGERRRSLP